MWDPARFSSIMQDPTSLTLVLPLVPPLIPPSSRPSSQERQGPCARYVFSYSSIECWITCIATSLFSQPRIVTRFPSRSL